MAGYKKQKAFCYIVYLPTYLASSSSNIDGVKCESAAFGISNFSSRCEIFLKVEQDYCNES